MAAGIIISLITEDSSENGPSTQEVSLTLAQRDCVVIRSEPFDKLRAIGQVLDFTIWQYRSW